MEFSTIQGDIAAQSADALVNAAGTSLEMGSGVAGALRRAAGDELNEAATAKGPVDLGEVAVTDAFDLDADYVIHAAAMPHYGDGKATEESIQSAVWNSLEAADELGCESLVIPVLGSGAAGFAFERAADLICSEIADYKSDTLVDVAVIAYADDQYDLLRKVAERTD
ncbi:macro domain-containing protein [Halohasta salina]|uniref:macro domain-containing protein n=1 Tax=Halohasta salina TaxID=2961621 RepID=UPI0020A45A28|nr:macro domain-containing protein [Halohasta salina]